MSLQNEFYPQLFSLLPRGRPIDLRRWSSLARVLLNNWGYAGFLWIIFRLLYDSEQKRFELGSLQTCDNDNLNEGSNSERGVHWAPKHQPGSRTCDLGNRTGRSQWHIRCSWVGGRRLGWSQVSGLGEERCYSQGWSTQDKHVRKDAEGDEFCLRNQSTPNGRRKVEEAREMGHHPGNRGTHGVVIIYR